ncbi:hypothetical protein FRC00_000876, partial [Tulasnella sp. 408]
MASTLQTTPSLDFETALAKFVAHGPVKNREALEDAIIDLLLTVQTAHGDVSPLLAALTCKSNGNDPAFTFRRRVLKAVQKHSNSPNQAFTACAERLGSFFFCLPQSIALDHNVITKHLAFSVRLASPDTSESDYFIAKKEKPVDPVTPKPPKPLKPSKRKTRFVPLELFTKDTPQTKSRRKATAQALPEKPSSPTVTTNRPAAVPSLSEQLKDCLEAYFTACLEDGVHEIAFQNLFKTLNPPILAAPNAPSARGTQLTEPPPSAPEAPATELPKSKAKSLAENALAPHDIARYLGETTKTTLGDWPVVVSQRGIKHLRYYATRDKITFGRIEKMIRQLSLGCFTESNHAKLLDQDRGVPIYTADLGGILRLIYQIDFGAPTGANFESQCSSEPITVTCRLRKQMSFLHLLVIRIFGVYQAPEIDVNFWKAVGAHLGGRGDEYIRRCTDRPETRVRPKRAKKVAPLVYPPMDVSHWNHQGADVEVDEAHRLDVSPRKRKKGRILTQRIVPIVTSNPFVNLPKIRSSNTRRLVSYWVVVGLGSGRFFIRVGIKLIFDCRLNRKTTCMVFRMIGLDVAAKKSGQTLRQVFVTQSRTLARKVRLYCAQLMQTETDAVIASAPKPAQGLSLLDMDENAEEEGVLPAKFSELDDSHFPLFVTYDQLCKLLEADFNLEFNPSPLPPAKTARAKNKKTSARQPLISFDYFDSKIWPHMDHKVKRGL